MSCENGCNIGNVPDCPECEALEEEIERMRPELAALRLQAKMMFTIEEVEAWLDEMGHKHYNNGAWCDLRDEQDGLAAHAKRKKEDEG